MQVIIKTVNEGKTYEAIKAAVIAAHNHPVLFVSTEESLEVLHARISEFMESNPAMVARYDIEIVSGATPEMFDDLGAFDEFGTIVMDVNHVMTRGPWLTICVDMEEYGYDVVATQELIRPAGRRASQVLH